MNRKQKLVSNTIISLIYQFTNIICGLILPRYILMAFGSEINGLVNSITQFLGFVSLAEGGIGAVVQAVLYKPLANKNWDEVNQIVAATDKFYRKIAYIAVVYIGGLTIIFSGFKASQFGFVYTTTLILIIGISTFVQYYFCMSYRLLLNADQLGFIQIGIQIITLIINTIASVVLIKLNCSIHLVKLVASVVFLVQPVVLTTFINSKYNLDRKVVLVGDPIKQKWNGLAQHISSFILGNTDIAVLTIFSTMTNVSIYSVYNLVVAGIRSILEKINSGFTSYFGNLFYSEKDNKKILDTFEVFEWGMHNIVTILFAITGVLILPFVQIYTNGIEDANYVQPIFGILITMAQGAFCLRAPYVIIIAVAGHFKETQGIAITEAILNIVISVILVLKFGLIGVAIGTLISQSYRTVASAYYLRNNILNRRFAFFVKYILFDILLALIICVVVYPLLFTTTNYLYWALEATMVSVISLLVATVLNMIVFKQYFSVIIKKIRRK